MEIIFEYAADDYGDSLQVERAGQELRFDTTAAIYLAHDQVRSLRDRLTGWLGESATPASVTLDDVHKAVWDAIAVLPLAQAPQARETGPGADEDGGAEFCEIEHCRAFLNPTHLEHDPEPQAVGHPEAPAINWSDKLFGKPDYTAPGLHFDYCTECGHSWGAHSGGGCAAQLGKSRCECTRVRSGAL